LSLELDNLPCGILQTADDGTIRRVNRTFCTWTDWPAEELVGRRLQDLFTVGGKIFHHTHWAPLLRMQGSVSEVKLEIVTRGGTSIPIVMNAIRRDHEGTVVTDIAMYVARDRDRYERELVRSRKKLEAVVAELNDLHASARDRAMFAEQMIGIVSHDLRNPLNAISMGAELLAGSDELPPSQRRLVERITRATDRATRLIAELLDFTQARVGSGIAVTRREISLHDVIADALDELRLAQPTHVLVHRRIGDAPAYADPSRLAQVVGNLISNAVSYGSSAPITVTSIAEPEHSSLAVHNEGAPIPAALQRTMFEPMTRGATADTGARSVGLGLFIVREIARAHGGTAAVTSTAAEGTIFRLQWPAARDADSRDRVRA